MIFGFECPILCTQVNLFLMVRSMFVYFDTHMHL